MEAMSVDHILEAIASLKPADRVRLVSRMAREICRAAMDDPDAMTLMLAECRRACHEPEAQRRMEFVLNIMGRMKGGD